MKSCQGREGVRGQRTQFHSSPYSTFDIILQQKDHKPGLPVTGREASCLSFYLLPFFFFSSGFASTVSIIFVIILEQLGVLLLTYSFSECDTNHSSLQAKGIGQGQLFFLQILWSLVQLMLVVKLYKTKVLKLSPSDCWGPAACASRGE